MYALAIVSIFILIIAYIIYREYKNEQAYQEERKQRSEKRKRNKAPYHPKEKIQQPHLEKKEKANKLKQSTPGAKEKPTPQQIQAQKAKKESYELKEVSEVTVEKKEESKKPEKTYDLPKCKYPAFDYSRLLGMGLSEEEAIEFSKELIPQIKTQIPLIKEAMGKEDYHSMERLTHSIKGSSTTVGTGGVSDLLVEFNTYLKSGKDLPIAEAYFTHLERYADDLEKQFA